MKRLFMKPSFGIFLFLVLGTAISAQAKSPVTAPGYGDWPSVPLYVKSDCVRDLEVLVWTWDPIARDYTNSGGWHTVRPGDKDMVASTEYNNAYIFVQSERFFDPAINEFRRITWSGSYSLWYNHERFRADSFGDGDISGHSAYTQTYHCN